MADSSVHERGNTVQGHHAVDSDPRLARSSRPINGANGQTIQYIQPSRTGYCYSSVMLLHMYKTDPTDPDDDEHPESPQRIARIFEVLQETKTLARMVPIKIREAVRAEAMLVHSEQLWTRIEAFQRQPPLFFDINRKFFSRLSLFVNEQTAMCARFSLGGVIECCRAVAEGKLQNAFAIVRPPGHHAEPETAMGFCFYNNVAVAAAYLKTMYKTREKPIRRVLILDWDVHHGNGTQRAFWTDPDVLYISLHVYQNGEFYPGGPYGSASMTGSAPGEGRCVNIPWPNSGATDADYIYAFQKIVMPIAYEFAPDFVLISAGFDAAEGDPLGGCHVSPAGFAHMTHMLSCLAEGKIVIALEGGYNVDAIANSALACVKVLLGDSPPMLEQLVASAAATSTCHLVAEIQSQHWRSIRPTFPPKAEYGTVAELVPVSETLKAYRTDRMWKEHKMYNVPFSDPELRQAFEDQLLITDNLYQSETETLVVFIHESGDIRAQLRPEEANIRLEGAFLVETANKIIRHVAAQGWALIDFNTNAHLNIENDANDQLRLQRNAVIHIWDHIVQTMLSVDNIVLIGLDSGCNSLVYLLNQRTAACQMRIKAAVQVYDHGTPESLLPSAKAPGLRDWFYELSMAIFPAETLVARDEAMYGKRFGKIVVSPERRTTRALALHWPDIEAFLQARIQKTGGSSISH